MKRILFASVLVLTQPIYQRIPHVPQVPTEVELLRGEVEELRNRLWDAEIRIHKLENPNFGLEPSADRKRLELTRYRGNCSRFN